MKIKELQAPQFFFKAYNGVSRAKVAENFQGGRRGMTEILSGEGEREPSELLVEKKTKSTSKLHYIGHAWSK